MTPPLRLIGGLFFERQYLTGKWFDEGLRGWVWVWRSIWTQKLLGINRDAPWPMGPFSRVVNPHKVTFHVDDLNNFQTFGCYIQGTGGEIVIGRGTYIGPNVGLITANHDPECLSQHLPGAPIHIGDYCWIGMNSVILPGVTLGNHTIVAAGSVVTKSFPRGHQTIAGVPARIIKSDQTTSVNIQHPAP